MFDLIILSVNQKTKSKEILNNTNIYLEYNQKYCDIWKFMTLSDGTWYNLSADKDEVGGTKICKYIDEKCSLTLDWVEKKYLEDITPYTIENQYMDSFIAILNHLVQQSPVKMIYVLARYQSYDKEIVLGTFTVNEFINLMSQRKIHSNICYIITGNLIM
ncbi:hypothetical protein [Acetanaerobacterium elongatum]|uniref:Uncharacterized protein n=1 Tax=Acetanaerobacterium elongatum TaxID=258515 RepID=A0A1G9WPQ3_9FIRM|nr:hypothetical protein [Acetanaerobacterium elongatum]SDM86502.1 hypothetical protein SAMN05192585_10681 [Acetanaerobacterium elongatum]